jgi:hypothetical protein
MAYADSAIDYTWEILRINVEQRLMQVKYSTADSARPDIVLNLEPRYNQFNESDLSIVATDAVQLAVVEWDKVIEALAENPSFDPSTLVGNSYNSRYKVTSYDNPPSPEDYNALTHSYEFYDSEGPDDICTKYNIVSLPEPARAVQRLKLGISTPEFWKGLLSDNRLDSALSSIGIASEFTDYDENDIDMVLGMGIAFGDSISNTIQSIYGYNDSDWAAWFVEKSGITVSFIQEY